MPPDAIGRARVARQVAGCCARRGMSDLVIGNAAFLAEDPGAAGRDAYPRRARETTAAEEIAMNVHVGGGISAEDFVRAGQLPEPEESDRRFLKNGL